MDIILIGIMAAVSAGAIFYSLRGGKADEQDIIKRRVSGRKAVDVTASIRDKAKESVTRKMMEKVAPLAMRPVMPKSDMEMSRLRTKLSNAGFRGERAPSLYLASKTVLAIGVALVTLLYSMTKGGSFQNIASMTIFGAAVGFMGPNLWLMLGVRKRAEQVRNGLPDSLDLLVISVESGLALDGAIQRVGDEMRNVHPVLSEEFQIATIETQMGIPRSQALENVAMRTGVPEMQSLVAIVNQAEKFGTSIASTLRRQADALRVKRRQAAEERAQKTTVKLMMPLMMFIFPCIFVVLLGPAALSLYDNLIKNNTVIGK